MDAWQVSITEDSVPPPPRKTSSMASAQERRRRMSRALSRRLSGKTVGSVEEGSALVAEDGGAIDDVLVEDLPLPDRRSLATTDVSLRSSAGDGEAAEHAAELPPGWEAHEDEQGAVYFYNVHTEEVQWEAPRL